MSYRFVLGKKILIRVKKSKSFYWFMRVYASSCKLYCMIMIRYIYIKEREQNSLNIEKSLNLYIKIK